MGRQSARLYYQGMDHKDIYFQHKFHIKMYKGNKLLWEKLYPDECLLTTGAYGIHIYDIENKCFDFMPVYNSQAQMNSLSCVGNALIVNLYSSEFSENFKWKLAYSTDAEVFKEIDEIKPISSSGVITSPTEAYTDNSRAFLVPADDNWYTIAKYDSGKLIFNKVLPYSSSDYISDFVPGKGKYINAIGYYRDALRGAKPLIYQVDNNGNIVDRLLFSNTVTTIHVLTHTYCSVGETIYSLGRTTDYNAYIVGRINKRSAVIEWDIDNIINYKVPSYVFTRKIISVSKTEVITTLNNADGDDIPILSFKEDGWSIANIIKDGYVPVASTSGDIVRVIASELFGHGVYMDNHKIVNDGHKHGLFYSNISGSRYGRYNIYFDNPYFFESNGNICEKIY